MTAVSGDVGGGDRQVPPGRPGITMLGPDFPFGYDEWLASPHGLGSVPPAARGTEVAVLGAGMAGVVAAYELMRLGLRPVVYEADEVGGRLRSVPFKGTDSVLADLGGMRFPASGRAWNHYVDLVGATSSPFPNPLTAAAGSTVVDLGGVVHYAESLADLPPFFTEVADAWAGALEEIGYSALQEAMVARDPAAVKAIWDPLVARLDDTSFYGFVASSAAFSALSYAHREAFGQVGFGTGGWDTDFPHTILEILRVVATGADEGQRRIDAGAVTVPRALWRLPVVAADDGKGGEDGGAAALVGRSAVHWPTGTSLASLHGGVPHPGVAALARADDGSIEVTDRWGVVRRHAAAVLTCQSWLLSATIDTQESLFDHATWMALDRTHYAQSSKTFVLVDRPFWKDRDPVTGRRVMSTTLSDRMTRATYLLEGPDGDDGPAIILLSYTWNDDALKWLSLGAQDRVRLMLRSLGEVYPGLDIASHIIGDPVTISWETDPHSLGAFRGALPGHYRYQRRLYSRFTRTDLPPEQAGIFLAGDDIGWTPGWVEGAVTTGLNAVWGVVAHLGGSSSPDNPGPGDRFADFGPVDLDAPR